jgi:hypothetical protein
VAVGNPALTWTGRAVYDFESHYTGCLRSGPPSPPGSTAPPPVDQECTDHIIVDAVTGQALVVATIGAGPVESG